MQIDRPIAIAIILFVTLLLVFFLVTPEYKKFGELQTDLGIKKAELKAQVEYYGEITRTYNELISRSEDIKKIDDALPSAPQDPILGNLVYFLQEVAEGNGLIVKSLFLSQSSLSNASSDNKNSIRDIVFSMDALGDYLAIGNFIMSLEKSSRIFEVFSITFNSQAGPPYSFNLQIKTHSY